MEKELKLTWTVSFLKRDWFLWLLQGLFTFLLLMQSTLYVSLFIWLCFPLFYLQTNENRDRHTTESLFAALLHHLVNKVTRAENSRFKKSAFCRPWFWISFWWLSTSKRFHTTVLCFSLNIWVPTFLYWA